jgi:hypothetical protein
LLVTRQFPPRVEWGLTNLDVHVDHRVM